MLPARAGIAVIGIAASLACAAAVEPTPLPQVTWTDCAEPATAVRCGSIRVREDRSSAHDREIEISFEVLAATGPRSAEPVLALSGGPGDPSTGLRDPITRVWSAVRERRDVVLVDQRGTGRSSPLHCRMNVAADPASAFGHLFDRGLFARCRETLAATHDLSAYRTDSAADDLDEIRAALGYEKIVLWGGSYGSRLAQSYMQRHAGRAAFVVLDGVVPIDVAITGRYPVHLQAAIDAIPDAAPPIRRIAARLLSVPAQTYVVDRTGGRVAVTMTIGDFAYAVRGILYGAQGSVQLPAMLQEAERSGDLSAFAQRYWERAARMDQALAHGLHLSVLCSEDVPFISAEDRRAAESTIGGTYILDEYIAACRIWDVPPVARPAPQSRPLPALLLSGAFDPVTPASMAERTAAWLPAARLFTAPRSGHGISFGCAAAAVDAALAEGNTASLPPVCPGR